jgi:DNA-binding transcriptional MerR regulator
VKIGELSRRTGVTVPTIKYYLRERLLPPGAATAANQADYTDEHVRRLRLIRALLDVGGLTVAATAEVLGRVDDPGSGHDLLGSAHRAISPATGTPRESPAWQDARDRAADLIRRRGWRVKPDAPALDWLADVIAALLALDQPGIVGKLDAYADSAQQLAAVDIAVVAEAPGTPAARVETAVIGTVLGEAMFNAVRRLAQEDASARHFAD